MVLESERRETFLYEVKMKKKMIIILWFLFWLIVKRRLYVPIEELKQAFFFSRISQLFRYLSQRNNTNYSNRICSLFLPI